MPMSTNQFEKNYAVIRKIGLSANERGGLMDAAVNRVAQEFRTRDNTVMLLFKIITMKWLSADLETPKGS